MTIYEVFVAIAAIRAIALEKHPGRTRNDKAYKACLSRGRAERITRVELLKEDEDSQATSDDDVALETAAHWT